MDKRLLKEKIFHDKRFGEENRNSVSKYYEITGKSEEYFYNLAIKNSESKRCLVLGCGIDSQAISIASLGGNVTGIDISDVAVKKSKEMAIKKNVSENTKFITMNAEELIFDKNEFDIVLGTAILHHLDLNKSLSEISRVLNQNGMGVFIEPLGHNPIINLFRKLTPDLRTEDEHPLKMDDLILMKSYFEDVAIKHFHLLTLFSVPFRKTFLFKPILTFLSKMDELLFSIPFFRKFSWQVVIHLSKSKFNGGC